MNKRHLMKWCMDKIETKLVCQDGAPWHWLLALHKEAHLLFAQRGPLARTASQCCLVCSENTWFVVQKWCFPCCAAQDFPCQQSGLYGGEGGGLRWCNWVSDLLVFSKSDLLGDRDPFHWVSEFCSTMLFWLRESQLSHILFNIFWMVAWGGYICIHRKTFP